MGQSGGGSPGTQTGQGWCERLCDEVAWLLLPRDAWHVPLNVLWAVFLLWVSTSSAWRVDLADVAPVWLWAALLFGCALATAYGLLTVSTRIRVGACVAHTMLWGYWAGWGTFVSPRTLIAPTCIAVVLASSASLVWLLKTWKP